MTDGQYLPWRTAMAEALYGENGFYRSPGAPAANFRTAAHASSLWAATVHQVAAWVDDSLGSPESFTVADVGAGGGELVTALAGLAPARWSLHGVDLAPRPADLPDRVSWSRQPAPDITGLLIATELLDVVPVDIVELTDAGPRLVEVASSGEERLGDVACGRDAEWLARWWPLTDIGDRAEIGWPRDDLWRSLTGRLDRGAAVAVDYAAVPSRDVAGTLAGYRSGRQARPIPDGSCDLTAHVVFESLASDGDTVMSQREALQSLGISATRPAYDGDPTSYLAALSAAGEAAELLEPDGLGGFTWLLHTKNLAEAHH